MVSGHTDNAKARMHVCYQPPRQGVQYLFLPLKKQFYVLTFQVSQIPPVLVCEHKNPMCLLQMSMILFKIEKDCHTLQLIGQLETKHFL